MRLDGRNYEKRVIQARSLHPNRTTGRLQEEKQFHRRCSLSTVATNSMTIWEMSENMMVPSIVSRGVVLLSLVAIATLLPVLLSERSGLQETAEAAPAEHGHVYLVRGIGNVFSLGMDSLADKLRTQGIRESVSNHLRWSRLAEKIAAEYKSNKRLAPIVIIGHSLGGNAALRIATKLGKAGVPVRLLVIFDATNATPVSANVSEAINFYYPSGRGDALSPGQGFKGKILNDDLKDLPGLKHMNMDESATLHSRVVAKVLRIFR